MAGSLKIETTGHTAILTLSRPERLNALDHELVAALHEALDHLAGQFPEIRAVILTGEGRGFCSGQDVSTLGGLAFAAERPSPADLMQKTPGLAPRLRELPQPVIAAVNGAAVGAGLALALASDIRIASEEARFSCAFVKRGLAPDTGASVLVTDAVGFGVAAELVLTGRIINAAEAHRVGLVNRVVPATELMAEAMAVAHEIAANPPLAVKATKQLLYRRQDLREILPIEIAASEPMRGTTDAAEAIRSFMEKRDPVYTGR